MVTRWEYTRLVLGRTGLVVGTLLVLTLAAWAVGMYVILG